MSNGRDKPVKEGHQGPSVRVTSTPARAPESKPREPGDSRGFQGPEGDDQAAPPPISKIPPSEDTE